MSEHPAQQTSVVFGYDRLDYDTSNQQQAYPGHVKPSSSQTKEDRYVSSIHFGVRGDGREFTTSSKLQDPTGSLDKYTGQASEEQKTYQNKTSLSLGIDENTLESSTQHATKYDPEKAREAMRWRDQVRKTTGAKPTRGISYDEKIEYQSEAKGQFCDKMQEFKPSTMSKETQKDLRATHFHVGYDDTDYSTSNYIHPLSPEEFKKYTTQPTPPHDLRKSNVDIA